MAPIDAGVELSEFVSEDAEWFIETSYQIGWEELIERAPDVTKLREIVGMQVTHLSELFRFDCLTTFRENSSLWVSGSP